MLFVWITSAVNGIPFDHCTHLSLSRTAVFFLRSRGSNSCITYVFKLYGIRDRVVYYTRLTPLTLFVVQNDAEIHTCWSSILAVFCIIIWNDEAAPVPKLVFTLHRNVSNSFASHQKTGFWLGQECNTCDLLVRCQQERNSTSCNIKNSCASTFFRWNLLESNELVLLLVEQSIFCMYFTDRKRCNEVVR